MPAAMEERFTRSPVDPLGLVSTQGLRSCRAELGYIPPSISGERTSPAMTDLPTKPDVRHTPISWLGQEDTVPPSELRRDLLRPGALEPAEAPAPRRQAHAAAPAGSNVSVFLEDEPGVTTSEAPRPKVNLSTGPFIPGPAGGHVDPDETDPARIAAQMPDPVAAPGDPAPFPALPGFPPSPGAFWFSPTNPHVALMVAAQYGDSIDGVIELAAVFEQWLHDISRRRAVEAGGSVPGP